MSFPCGRILIENLDIMKIIYLLTLAELGFLKIRFPNLEAFDE
jgi:hypothetical protein